MHLDASGTRDRATGFPQVEVEGEKARHARRSRTGGSGAARSRHESEAVRRRRIERESKVAERRRRIRRQATLAVLGGAVVLLLWLGVYRSPLFTIESVEIAGTSSLDAEEVRSRIVLPEGATLLRLPAREIEEALERDPWVADASLSRRVPSTLRVTIEERVPVALADTGTDFWFIDGDGRFLGLAALESTASPVPVIRDVPALGPTAGSITEAPALVNALRVLAGIDPALGSQVRAVSAASQHETTLITKSGVEVMVGEAVQLTEKSEIALGIMEEQGSEVVFIDVRSVERPISRGLSR